MSEFREVDRYHLVDDEDVPVWSTAAREWIDYHFEVWMRKRSPALVRVSRPRHTAAPVAWNLTHVVETAWRLCRIDLPSLGRHPVIYVLDRNGNKEWYARCSVMLSGQPESPSVGTVHLIDATRREFLESVQSVAWSEPTPS